MLLRDLDNKRTNYVRPDKYNCNHCSEPVWTPSLSNLIRSSFCGTTSNVLEKSNSDSTHVRFSFSVRHKFLVRKIRASSALQLLVKPN